MLSLSGRVENKLLNTGAFVNLNQQFFPGIKTHDVDAIGVESTLAGEATLSKHPVYIKMNLILI